MHCAVEYLQDLRNLDSTLNLLMGFSDLRGRGRGVDRFDLIDTLLMVLKLY